MFFGLFCPQAATYYKTLHFPDERKFICESAASASVIGHVASALWTCAITVYLFLSVSVRAIVLANKLVYLFYVFCFGMPRKKKMSYYKKAHLFSLAYGTAFV